MLFRKTARKGVLFEVLARNRRGPMSFGGRSVGIKTIFSRNDIKMRSKARRTDFARRQTMNNRIIEIFDLSRGK